MARLIRRGFHKMRVERYQHSKVFLERAAPYLLSAEEEHGMLLGLGSRAFEGDFYLAAVEHEAAVIACAARTPPFGLVVSRAADVDAVAVLVEDVADKYEKLPSVFGPEPTVSAFAEAWADKRGIQLRPFMRMRLFAARHVRQPTARPAGRFRPAAASDLATLARWVAAFHTEARTGHPLDPEQTAREDLASGRLFVWDDAGIVSLAKGFRRGARAAHIGLAFSSPEHRGRGYASALVAALSQTLLSEGAAFCCINADTTNATTNKIYPALGYRLVCETSHIEFTAG
jgi:predicted GNAT family acetyltransferase